MEYYLQIKNDKILSGSMLPVIDEDIQNVEITEEEYIRYMLDNNSFYVKNGVVKEKTEQQKREEILANQFFNTSLGYVRRQVTMKDGSTRDFLTDILPLLAVGVPILVYSSELEQSRVLVTEPFINECKQQLLTDFYGVA
jgi:hypothetical protein